MDDGGLTMAIYMTFDVETVGLYGEAFAVGGVVTDDDGITLDEFIYSCPHYTASPSRHLSPDLQWADRVWVMENVVPTLPEIPKADRFTAETSGPGFVRQKMMREVSRWSDKAAHTDQTLYLCADVCFPCETNFLVACLPEWPSYYAKLMPYPLIDIATFLCAKGYDPVGSYERLNNELPAHNPLNDARQSSRILHQLLRGDAVI